MLKCGYWDNFKFVCNQDANRMMNGFALCELHALKMLTAAEKQFNSQKGNDKINSILKQYQPKDFAKFKDLR